MELFERVLNVVFSEYGLIGAMFLGLFYWELKTTKEREAKSIEREEKLQQINILLLESNKELLDSNKTVLSTNQSLCDKIDIKIDFIIDMLKNKNIKEIDYND